MYTILLDGKLMHDPNIPNLEIFSPKVSLEHNVIGTFEFSIYNTHPYYDQIYKMASKVKIYYGEKLIFSGRVLDLDEDTVNKRAVYCENVNSYLCDSIQMNYEYSGTVRGFIEMIINTHNSQVEDAKKLTIGEITVTDPNDYITREDTQWLTTWETVQQKLIDLMGGYIWIDDTDDGLVFNYYDDFDTLNSQTVEFGENLLTVQRTTSGAEIATVIIPLGAEIEGSETREKLTIADVNNGSIFLEDADGIDKYGRIVKVVTFDDVTVAQNLKTKGQQALVDALNVVTNIEMTAVDMQSVNMGIEGFALNAKIHVISKYHGIDDYFLPLKIDVELFKPENNKITLNGVQKTITDDMNQRENGLNAVIDTVEQIKSNYEVNVPIKMEEMEQRLTSSIEQTANTINMEVSESYYTKDDTNALISSVQTVFEQNKDYFEMQFNTFSQNLEDVQSGTNAKFEEQSKYIRFIDGKIVIGESGDTMATEYGNGRISFKESGYEVSYISGRALHTTDIVVSNSLQMNNFAWIPRSNGNISLRKVR